MPVVEPEAGPRPRGGRGNEAAVERAGAALNSSDEWRVTSDEQPAKANLWDLQDWPRTTQIFPALPACDYG
ncbi:MAG: hypothetical protein ABSH01_05730 [Terriglobia bacterium]